MRKHCSVCCELSLDLLRLGHPLILAERV
jgi:hypothetical protein